MFILCEDHNMHGEGEDLIGAYSTLDNAKVAAAEFNKEHPFSLHFTVYQPEIDAKACYAYRIDSPMYVWSFSHTEDK